jgi:chaperonin GroES
MKIRPLHDRILIKRVAEEETVRGGIIIPDAAREKPQQGEVIAVGDGKILENGQRVPLDVKVGDLVLFSKYAGSEVPTALKMDGEDYLILREDEVLGILAEVAKPVGSKK